MKSIMHKIRTVAGVAILILVPLVMLALGSQITERPYSEATELAAPVDMDPAFSFFP